MQRTLFIGDVHGCYDELIALCEHMCLTPEDHLYFVGDLINKWPKSLEVVEWVRNRPNTWSVIGNHEYFSLMTSENLEKTLSEWADSMSEWRKNWILGQYKRSTELRELFRFHRHIDWLLSLPTTIETEDFILVHGGLHPDFGLDTPTELATLIRLVDGRPWYESYTGEKLVIYGHWAAEWLRMRANTLGLDTGCCFGGALTAYCLESWEFWQVRANTVYKEPMHWRGKSEE